jgi:hypothetical protein
MINRFNLKLLFLIIITTTTTTTTSQSINNFNHQQVASISLNHNNTLKRQSTPSSSFDFDINNLTALAQLSHLMVNRMQTWYRTDHPPHYM